jgi:FtsH-binding integral membrane protein
MAIQQQCLNCKNTKANNVCSIKGQYLMFDGSSCQQYSSQAAAMATQTLNPPFNPNVAIQQALSGFMTKVYMWMFFALLLTALMAGILSNSEAAMQFIYGNKVVFWGMLIGELALVFGILAAIKHYRLSWQASSLLFILYSLMTGITTAYIFLLYTQESIMSTFLVTSATFGAMKLYGYFTKTDLTKWGQILIMALIGLIIASIVNIFGENSTLYWITTYAGVLIFVGLIAYDTQKLKNIAGQITDNETAMKLSILGGLTLYLDFINLFLKLLRILGRRK